MPNPNTDFKREIIKIIVDKLLIGVLLLMLGIFATNIVEKFKTEQTFRAELNKTRVLRIGEVWELMYLYEAAVDDVVNHFTTIVLETKTDEEQLARINKELAPKAERADKIFEDLMQNTYKNRFWIGESTFTEIIGYTDVLGELMDAYSRYDAEQIRKINGQREKLRKGVRQIRDQLLGE